MNEIALPIALALGVAHGFRHAFEPDHVAAVSTLVGGEARLGRSVRLGLVWGAGHTTTLVLGVLLIGLLKLPVSDAALAWLEAPVGVMLVALGASAIRDAAAPRPVVAHARHAREGWAGYAVGLVHGMAGSGALLLLVAAALPTLAAGVGYAVLFGLGSVLGMGAVTLALSAGLRAARTRPALYRGLVGITGVLSAGLGLVLLADLFA